MPRVKSFLSRTFTALEIIINGAISDIIDRINGFVRNRIGNIKAYPRTDPEYQISGQDKRFIADTQDMLKNEFPGDIFDIFKDMSLSDRICKLESIMKKTAKIYGINYKKPCYYGSDTIINRQNTETMWGYYDWIDKIIALNINMLSSNDRETLINVVCTAIHETYHVYQDRVITDPAFGKVDNMVAIIWSLNFNHYIYYYVDPKGYYEQPLEVSARNVSCLSVEYLRGGM